MAGRVIRLTPLPGPDKFAYQKLAHHAIAIEREGIASFQL
jgi:hypothetical protein